MSVIRNFLHKFVPSNFHNFWGLAWRLITEGKPAGRMAMVYAFLGLLCAPLDLILQINERWIYKRAERPKLPQVFVCGPPRSGTTVVSQVLTKFLDVHYFNNLTSLFPRAPITATKLFGWLAPDRRKDMDFRSFYGRTARLAFPNDALYFWDRWTGVDREIVPKKISKDNQEKMQRFFGAMEQHFGKPSINKNNSLNTYADLIAKVLDKSYFICLDRDPVYLAQSLLIASRFIHGDENIPYGIIGSSGATQNAVGEPDPVKQVCEQVLWHKKVMMQQEELIGKERFIIVNYEDFCADPSKWVSKISWMALGEKLEVEDIRKSLKPFKISNKRKLDEETFSKIEDTFTKMEIPI